MQTAFTFEAIISSKNQRVVYVPQSGYESRRSSWNGRWMWWVWMLVGLLVLFAVSVLVLEIVVYATSPVMPDSALCISSYIESNADAKRIRSVLGSPNGFSSCAVVGSAGFLRLQRIGKEIDGHEFVIRANLAPVAGYEAIVGSKTSLRVLNSEALGSILHEKSCSNSSSILASMCPSYPVYLNTADWWMVSKYKKLCTNTTVFDNKDLDAWDPALHAQWQGLGTNLMSGAYAIAIALKICPNGTTVYGVSHEDTFELNNNKSASYHYYDERMQSTLDSLPKSAVALSRFSKTQDACLKLHSPSALHSKFELPVTNQSSKRVDALVDDVMHNKARNTYLSHKNICL